MSDPYAAEWPKRSMALPHDHSVHLTTEEPRSYTVISDEHGIHSSYVGPPGVKKRKDIRLIRSTLNERVEHPYLTVWRVEQLAYGIDWFTVAGFPTLEEAKAYRRKMLRERRLSAVLRDTLS